MPIDPNLFASVPFKNRTALTDFAGTLFLWHLALQAHINDVLPGTSYAVLPIGTPGGQEWLHAIQQTYQNAARALGIGPPQDLESYDLSQEADWRSWTFLISQESLRLRVASGLG